MNEDRPDLVQDITTAVIVELLQFRQQSKFSAWVHEICLRKITEERRRLARERKVFDKNKEVVSDLTPELDEHRGNQVVPVENYSCPCGGGATEGAGCSGRLGERRIRRI